VDYIGFKFYIDPQYSFVLIGWQKNMVCALGLLAIALVPCITIIRAVYKALSRAND
jgi:hypothetical protein